MQTSPAMAPDRAATSEDVRRALGDVEDHVVAEVLSWRPTLADLTGAVLWVRGDGDLDARESRTLTASAQAVLQYLIRLQEEELDEGAPAAGK
ncbi:MAG TPA: hypothetical protein VG943_10150 [Caulobacterales bacterium]|nr:hypothetical protein [Caulobacterales bacterium]